MRHMMAKLERLGMRRATGTLRRNYGRQAGA